MNPARRRLTVRTSKGRLVFWAACLAVICYLAYQLTQAPVASTGRVDSAQIEGAGPTDGRPLQGDGTAPSGTPAVRFGTLARTAHLVALSGLEGSLYALAARADGGLEARIFDHAANLYQALLHEELEMATVPIRDALRLFLELGERAPRIVAGAARGDEMFLVRKSVEALSLENLLPVRVGLLEPPRLDLRRALRLDGKAPPTVILKEAGEMAHALASKEIDLALLPEPLASMTAALSGSRVEKPSDVPGGRLAGGAVLVASPRLIAEHPELLDRLSSSTFFQRSTFKEILTLLSSGPSRSSRGP
ncbi:MAG: hypothetical protein V2A76_04860 [Planctomycetota bacterium]